MNLFTEYTKEETLFLLELKKSKILNVNYKTFPIFNNVDKKDFSYFKAEKIDKKEVLYEYDFIYIISGKIAVLKDKTIIKILSNDSLFGLSTKVKKTNFSLITLTETKIIKFDIKNNKSPFFFNALNHIILKEDLII